MKKIKNTIYNILLLLAAIVLCVIFAEILLRFFYIRDGLQNNLELYTNGCYVKNRPVNIEDRYVSKKANTNVSFKTNSQGFRDDEHSFDKPAGVYRIVMVGDSMLEGREVELEERFDTLLENNLNALGKNVEVIALAVSSNSPMVYNRLLECLGYSYQPDLVVVNYFPQNDFRTLKFDDKQLKKHLSPVPPNVLSEKSVPITQNAYFVSLNAELFGRRESRLLMFMQDITDQLKQRYRPINKNIMATENSQGMEAYFGVGDQDVSNTLWNNNAAILGNLADEAKLAGTQVLLANLSMSRLVQRDEGSATFSVFNRDYSVDDTLSARQKEVLIASTTGMYYIDLHEALRADYLLHGETKNIYSADKMHYGAHGHEVVANTLTEYILDNILK